MTGTHGQRMASAASSIRRDAIPTGRLTAIDIRHRAEWIVKDWRGDERAMTRLLNTFRAELEYLPEPYRARALEGHAVLERARIANGHPWQAALEQIKIAALDWEASRSPLVSCGIGGCQIKLRSTAALLEHRNLVHDRAA